MNETWGVLATAPRDVVVFMAWWHGRRLPDDYPRGPSEEELIAFWRERVEEIQ